MSEESCKVCGSDEYPHICSEMLNRQYGGSDPGECKHVWVSNSGEGGQLEFGVQFGQRTMRVRCRECRLFVFVSPLEWRRFERRGKAVKQNMNQPA